MEIGMLAMVNIVLRITITHEVNFNRIKDHALKAVQNVDFPSALEECNSTSGISRLSCVSLCVQTPDCDAVYLTEDIPVSGIKKWNCRQCRFGTKVPTNILDPGRGDLIVFKYLHSATYPPMVPNGTIQEIQNNNNNNTVAFYQCDLPQTLKLAMDEENNYWPRLRGPCLNRLCSEDGRSISASVMTVSVDANGYTFHPKCKSGETTDGESYCDFSGTWTFTGNTGVNCISDSCYRKAVTGRSAYKGTRYYTDIGMTCQRWDVNTPHTNLFPDDSLYIEDGYDKSKADDHCRDVNSSGEPWCYTEVVSKEWAYCGVEVCK